MWNRISLLGLLNVEGHKGVTHPTKMLHTDTSKGFERKEGKGLGHLFYWKCFLNKTWIFISLVCPWQAGVPHAHNTFCFRHGISAPAWGRNS